ncbi:MAG: Asp-tRNA(Asn)/Glu-tRNA(Gln) amidotransferase subunit GatA [Candidatus Xenobia bacterium]
MELCDRSARELLALLDEKKISAVELLEATLQRIQSSDGALHAFLTVTESQARAAAQEADRRRATGEHAPLLGLPVALKDNMCMQGVPCTCGSRILENFVPPYDATVTRRLLDAGAVIVGKTNLDEFAMGSSTENSAFGPSRNPWDTSRVPGGSSGGSAVAVASGLAALALGSDTGGSIRQPAALTGISGLKPTYGLVSRYGLVAYASSLDQIGPMGRDVEDVALMLEVIAGHDPLDSTSLETASFKYTPQDVAGMRLGLPREYFGSGLDPDVEAAVRAAARELEAAGAKLVDVSLPNIGYALSAYYIMAPAEASSNLARYDGARYGLRVPSADVLTMFKQTRAAGFGAEVKRRIMIGTYALSAGYYDAYYLKAQKVRTLLQRDFDEAFRQCDALLCPTTPAPAFRIGEKADDPLQMYLSDIYTVAVNLAGLPGLSIPCGEREGLPIGLQLIGPVLGEATLLRLGAAYQRRTSHHLRRPQNVSIR